jgi:hypothetical protein
MVRECGLPEDIDFQFLKDEIAMIVTSKTRNEIMLNHGVLHVIRKNK